MYDDEKDQNDEIVVDARPHVVNNRRKGTQFVRKSPRYVAQVVARAKRFGFKVSQFNDLSILISRDGDQAILFYPDEDSEPLYDFRPGDRVRVCGRDSIFNVVRRARYNVVAETDEGTIPYTISPEIVNHVVE